MNQKIISTCAEIKSYITINKNDYDSSWEYKHTPDLTYVLSNLNETESQYFSEIIFSWSEFHLYELADPIIFSDNKYLGADLYIKIFSKVKNTEYLDYLVENVIHYIRPPYYNSDRIKDWSTELIINLNSNVNKLIDIKGDGWKTNLKQVNNFLNDVIETRIKNYS